MSITVLGWTKEQWATAEQFYNDSNKEQMELPPFWSCLIPGTSLSEYIEVQSFWNTYHMWSPLERVLYEPSHDEGSEPD